MVHSSVREGTGTLLRMLVHLFSQAAEAATPPEAAKVQTCTCICAFECSAEHACWAVPLQAAEATAGAEAEKAHTCTCIGVFECD